MRGEGVENLDFVQRDVGVANYKRRGTTLPDSIVDEALAADAVVLVPCGMPDNAPRERSSRLRMV